jgi:Eco57I restriction-modification methylase
VAARWKHDGRRPNTHTLREILYNQITGLDTNEAALRFAALGLYLLSIELDPHPEPLRKLKFKNMRKVVLQKFEATENERRSLGSLGPEVGKEHVGRYDLVIGNPPWTSGTRLPNWSTVKEIVGEIAKSRLGTKVVPPLPNEVLDLPFVWRAMEWAKPGSQIVFALHGRILFQQGDRMHDARKALFQALDVTSVVNGAELRQTKVWPEISAPFCILFARNQLPSEGSGFRLVTPRLEQSLNKSGNMRIDAASAEIVTPREIVDHPPILKILSRGSRADLEVYDRMLSKNFPTLRTYWSKTFRGWAVSGNGYQRLRASSRIRKQGDGQKGASAHHLNGLPEVTPASMQRVLISEGLLSEFQHVRMHDPRPRELFRGPLLILQKSPPAGLGRIRAAVSKNDVVFNETYYGYSACKHPDGFALVQYLAMILGSKPALWLALMTSGEFGFERDVIEKATIDGTVLPPFDDFTPAERRNMDDLFASVTQGSVSSWDAVDAWAARLFGLKPRDLEVISQTLEYSLPFANNRKSAESLPTGEAVRFFCTTLNSELEAWASRFGKKLTTELVPLPSVSPWRTLTLCAHDASQESPMAATPPWFEFFKVADHLAASELTFEDREAKCIWIGRLDQARYWTQTRARLVARQIIWEHTDFLVPGDE